jgi:3-methyladenine DNA glycosylase AlkD
MRARPRAVSTQVREALAWLERRGTKKNREGMARYGIRPKKRFGVSMATMQPLVRRLGRDHALALALYRTGWHEARILASFVDEPDRVTPAQMDAWAQRFDNWAVCDSVCLHLFDRSPHAWAKVREWSRRDDEYVKRAAFALVAGLASHDESAPDAAFARCLPLVERAATDDRNYVKKAVNWALRQIGHRSVPLNAVAVEVASRLAASPHAAARWVGRDAFRELKAPATMASLARRARSLVS